jgi:hypothetical protein
MTRLALLAPAMVWFFMLVSCSTKASAAFLVSSGNGLLAACQDKDPFNRGACYGYIVGINEATAWAAESASIIHACPPQDVKVEQLRDVVVRWLEVYPERRPYSAASLVTAALAEAFPCKN